MTLPEQPLRVALAAVGAWLAAHAFGEAAEQYAYYGPLGAVVAVTASPAGSVRESLQIMGAMLLGVGLAVATTPLSTLWSLLVVVGLGTAARLSWPGRWLGGAATWVPLTGLFVLVIGGDSPWEYAGAYLGLTTLGAVVGTAVTFVWPPLPLREEAEELEAVRDDIAARLESVAAALSSDRPPTRAQWSPRTDGMEALLQRMRDVATSSTESRRGNWRVRRLRAAADSRYEQARAFERLAFLVEDLTGLLADQENDERQRVALGPELRPTASRTLADLAAVLRSLDIGIEATVDPRAAVRADTSVEALVEAMREVRRRTGDDLVTAGAVVTVVRRTLDSLVPVQEDDDPAAGDDPGS